MTFRKWLDACDDIITASLGVGREDLIDCTWRDWFDAGLTPDEACSEILDDPYAFI